MRDSHVVEGDLLDGLLVVTVPLRDLGLTGSEVGAEEDHGAGLVGDADSHGALVPRCPAKPSLDVLDTDISEI